MRGCICREIDYPYIMIERAKSIPEKFKDGITVEHNHIDCQANDIHMMQVCKTEAHLNETNPKFRTIKRKMTQFCNSDPKALLRISVKNMNPNEKDHKIYGFCTTTLELIVSNNQRPFPIFSKNGKVETGQLTFKQSKILEQPSFTEYLKSGWHINMSVAIDYTASNGDPRDPDSLHRYDKDDPNCESNQYEIAMEQVGRILETYAFKKKFMAYGFGGVPDFMGEKEVSHCFPLNGKTGDPSVDGLTKLIQTYRESLSGVKLWGPTFFKTVHERVFQFIQEKLHFNLYHVLLILTDGCIHDMRQTIDVIVQASSFPLSIIIIGIGNSDFANMAVLDADEFDLVDSNGREASRDIVQFVKYNDYSGNIAMLAEQVLCEVPDQMVTYMMENGKKPTDINENEKKKPKKSAQ